MPKLIRDIRLGEAAAKSGDKDEMVKSLRDGTEDTIEFTPLLKSNPEAYELAKKTPAIAQKLIDEIIKGTKQPKDINDAVEYFDKIVKDSLPK